MEQYISTLAQTKLFSGMTEEEISAMLSCLSAVTKTYAKGEYIFRSGERISSMALLLSGLRAYPAGRLLGESEYFK